MIHELDETIRKLILTRAGLPADGVEVSFDQPTGDWAAGLTRPTINCYLYDIREDLALRSAEWLVERGEQGQAQRRPAPRRFDLSYLITVWTQNQTEDEHAILWRVLGALSEANPIPAELWQGALVQQSFPLRTQTAQPSMAVQNMPDLWGVMENQLRPSIDYVVTMSMEREVMAAGPLVLSARVGVRDRTQPEQRSEESYQIAGIVHDSSDEEPVAGAVVTLSDSGRVTRSDRYGRFSLSGLLPGEYRITVALGDKQAEHTLAVPAQGHDHAHYDLAL